MKVNRIVENLKNKARKLQLENEGFVIYAGTDTQGISVKTFVAKSIEDLFNQLVEIGMIHNDKLEQFYVFDEETVNLVITEDEMEEVIVSDSTFYYNILLK